MLEHRPHGALLEAGRERRRVGGHREAVGRERAHLPLDEVRRPGGHVGNRGEIDVDAVGRKRGARVPAARHRRRRRQLPELLGRPFRRRPGDAPHLAALLVDRDDEPRPAAGLRGRLERRRERLELRLRHDVPREEDHTAHLAGADAGEDLRVRVRPGHRDDEALADELGERRRGGARRRGGDADRSRRGAHGEDDSCSCRCHVPNVAAAPVRATAYRVTVLRRAPVYSGP